MILYHLRHSGYLENDELEKVATRVWTNFTPYGEHLAPECITDEAQKIGGYRDNRGRARITVADFGNYFEKAANVILRFRKKVSELRAGEILDVTEQSLLKSLPVLLCDGIPLLAEAHANQITEHLEECRKKFNELDADNDGLLMGDDINKLVMWTWSNFKPGELAC